MTFVRLAIATMFAACNASSAAPRADAAIADAAVAPIVDESAPATLAFTRSPEPRLSGHMRASWPLNLPEMPWTAASFIGMSLHSYDGRAVVGSVEMHAAPGLDANKCTIELVWQPHSKSGVQLRGAPTIDRVDPQAGAHATWRFRAPVAGTPPAASATAFAFCPNGVTFYSIESVVAGPKTRDAYCKTPLRSNTAHDRMIGNHQTFEMMFACGALIRMKGRALVDDCRGDTLLSLDALGPGVTASAPASGTPITDEELRQWSAGGTWCSHVQLAADPPLTHRARWPYAKFRQRAGGRLVNALSRDGMIQP